MISGTAGKIAFVILSATVLMAQQKHADRSTAEHWKPVHALIGSWRGQASGEPGHGRVERTYAFVLRGAFIEVRNRSIYPPQGQKKGEIHEDRGFISYDRNRKKLVLRQFHIEGFVNQYVLSSVSPDGRTVVFESESIENIETGWRAKETYVVEDGGKLVERFELAAPGKDYQLYTQNTLRRQ